MVKPGSSLRMSAREVLDFLLPRACCACESMIGDNASRDNPYLCLECSTRFDSAPTPDQIYNDVLSHIGDDRLSLHRICSRYAVTRSHDDPVLRMMHALKYRGLHRLGEYLGKDLAHVMQLSGMNSYDLVIPVPIHRARRRERGYNQAESIAVGITRHLDLPLDITLIRRTRYTASQTRKRNQERMLNVSSAFALRGDASIRNANLLLVDDVLTTGATLNAIAATLLEAGARSVDAVTIAKAV